MKLLLLNPFNPVVSLSKIQRWNRLNKYRVWKPLGLLILARLTPPDWEVEVIDENLGPVDAQVLPRADLVGITAFTSQATRAYELAALFRARGVPVVMGGIHATMCLAEALGHADTVVTGEAGAGGAPGLARVAGRDPPPLFAVGVAAGPCCCAGGTPPPRFRRRAGLVGGDPPGPPRPAHPPGPAATPTPP